ncbi:MAG TPA: hypothetical protein PKK00_05100 [Bacteroidales bacterium]|nr:hypothetical protein [Bacteroidales bacterium]HPS16736.1 hypothetical protein [Bacteroidales bacterium]
MKYFEQKLEFKEPLQLQSSDLIKSFSDNSIPTLKKLHGDAQEAGIIVRLGNEPIVRNLEEVLTLSNSEVPPEIKVLFNKCKIFTIVHAIGAIRVEGKAHVNELQYHAEVITSDGNFQTIDLLPNTRFKEVFKANINFSGSMSANGNFGIEIPDVLKNNLSTKYLSLGGDMKIQLASEASFIGKFTYSVKFPVVQSIGIASNKCSWVLNPDEEQTPLLGDQLLVQTIAVPKEANSIKYNIYGVLKVDRGLWWKQQTKNTDVYSVDVSLN